MNLNENALADLKQLVATTIKTEMRAVVKEELNPISQKLDDLTDFVREALDTANEASGEQLTDHEQRITKLETTTT